MQGFEDVTLSWQCKDFTVPANKQMMLIARIEDALAGEKGEQAISVLFRKGGPPFSRLAGAYGAALRFAGAQVSDEVVYLTIQSDIAQKSKSAVAATMQAMLVGLIAIISPPASYALTGKTMPEPETTDPKKP